MIRHSRNRRHAYERNADRQRFFAFYQEDQQEMLLTSADLTVREGWIDADPLGRPEPWSTRLAESA